ncbi:MAG TPA: J domain-containing protein, partial [Solirubrobacteraceae bacterium]|nr:J domain-containing protein [Solirubrobacteraceae bacterium]
MAADPFAVLDVAPGASLDDVTASYRRLAKQWHPDRGGGPDAARRMAEINVAYEILRSGAWQERRR